MRRRRAAKHRLSALNTFMRADRKLSAVMMVVRVAYFPQHFAIPVGFQDDAAFERCKINGAALPVTRAERWKARAEECRTLADCFTDPICRGQLTRLAQDYDQMALVAE